MIILSSQHFSQVLLIKDVKFHLEREIIILRFASDKHRHTSHIICVHLLHPARIFLAWTAQRGSPFMQSISISEEGNEPGLIILVVL